METNETRLFNQPYKTTVAIDCRHIGDDNDYSCFLSDILLLLYKAGHKEQAYKLSLTDPMLCNEDTMQQFEERMQHYIKCEIETKENYEAYWRAYHD